jgi:hypothetical protein
LANSFKKAEAWPPRAPNSVTAKGMKRMTPHPLRILLELGLVSAAESDVGRWGARNAEQIGYHGINSKF